MKKHKLDGELIDEPLDHSPESEQTILGSVILDHSLIDKVEPELKPHELYIRANQFVYAAMIELAHEGQPLDPHMIANKLRDEGRLEQVGGISYLSELTFGIPHFTDITKHVRVVKKKALKRKITHLGSAISNRGLDKQEDPEDDIAWIDAALDALREEANVVNEGFRSFAQVASDISEDLDMIEQGVNPSIAFGMPLLDLATGGGGRPGELHVWGALTGKGKSALMKQMAHNIAGRGEVVGIVTAEMADKEVFYRILAPESGVPAWHVHAGLRPEQLKRLRDGLIQVGQLPIWIDDRTTNINQIRARAKALYRATGGKLKVLFVDYLQLLDVRGEDFGRFVMTRAQEVAYVSKTLKKLAKELGILIIALAQFNRTANAKDELTKEVKPEIHQFAESSGIEKDADLAGIIDMPEYVQGQPERDCSLRIAKFRRMPPFTLPYTFNGDYMIFFERGTKLVLGKKEGELPLPEPDVARGMRVNTAEHGTDEAQEPVPDSAEGVPDSAEYDETDPYF
jgi:replicative DNA helicase